MYTGRMTFDELERFYYITGDSRHAVLGLVGEVTSDAHDEEIADLERERDDLAAGETAAQDERDRMGDERDEARKEVERLRAENNMHMADLLKLRAHFG